MDYTYLSPPPLASCTVLLCYKALIENTKQNYENHHSTAHFPETNLNPSSKTLSKLPKLKMYPGTLELGGFVKIRSTNSVQVP